MMISSDAQNQQQDHGASLRDSGVFIKITRESVNNKWEVNIRDTSVT